MKRRFIPLLLLLLAIFSVVSLASCGGSTCKVEFYDGETLLYTYLVDKGKSLDEIPDAPEREGYVSSWSIEDFDEVNANLKVFAVYTQAKYTIRFYVDGDLFLTRQVNRNAHLNNVPAVPVKEGFSGAWSVADFSVVDRDLDVHAVYTADDVKMTFVVDDAVLFVSDVEDGRVLYVPAIPAVQGKNVSGKWVLGSADGTTAATFTGVSVSTTVYAHRYVELTLVDGDADSLSTEIDETISSPAAGRKAGYDFLGWYADADYRNEITFPHAFSENGTLYARWLKNAYDEGFAFSSGVLTAYAGSNANPVVPYKYNDGQKDVFVTSVAEGAFDGNTSLVSITLPSTVEEIGAGAFRGATNLASVRFSDGCYLRSIGEEAFKGCVALTSFSFSKFTTEIGRAAFDGCSAVNSYVDLEKTSVADLPADVFKNNTSVEAFNLPATVTSIGTDAFKNDFSAGFVFGGKSIATVGEGAFTGCLRLRTFLSTALTSIGNGAFTGCRSLASVTVTSDKSIRLLFGTSESTDYFYSFDYDAATWYLPNALHTVVVAPNARTNETPAGTLVEGAFYGAKTVKEVELLRGVKNIEERAFSIENLDSSSEFSIVLPEGLESVGDYAFSGRNDLRSVAFPMSLSSIGEEAFAGIERLATVTIPDNSALTSVGAYAFRQTAWFDGAAGVVLLGRVALGVSDRIGKYELSPDDFGGADTIAPHAFDGDVRLNKIALSDGIVTVGDGAFANTELRELVLNAACEVGESILYGSSLIRSLTVGAGKKVEELFGQTAFADTVAYVKDAKTYYIPETFTDLTIIADRSSAVAKGVYCGFTTLRNVIIAEGITAVYDGAFTGNTALKSIVLPKSLLSIGNGLSEEETDLSVSAATVLSQKTGVFSGSETLDTMTLPQDASLRYVYGKSFYGTSISTLYLPQSVEYVGAYAFADVPFSDLRFVNGERELVFADYAFARVDLSEGSFDQFRLTLPAGLKKVGKYAFSRRNGITSVDLNDDLALIGDGAFDECAISKLIVPANVAFDDSDPKVGAFHGNPVVELTLYTEYSMVDLFGGVPGILNSVRLYGDTVGEGEFSGVTALQNVELFGVAHVGAQAFYGCTSLVRVEIPASVETVGDEAFASCTALRACVFSNGSRLTGLGKDVFKGDISLTETDVPDTVADEEFAPFDGCVSLIRANIPSSVLRVGENAFKNCEKLVSVTIPSGVESIGAYAFYGCGTLEFENIRFDELTSIGAYAFAGCKLLHAVKAENIDTIGDNAFAECDDLKEITLIDKKVSEIVSAPEKILSVNLSSAATVVDDVFDGCVHLTSISVYAAPDGVETVLQKLSAEERYGAKIFVTKDAFAAVSAGLKETLSGTLFVNPSDVDATYSYDEDAKKATLVSVDDYTSAVLYLPAYVEKDDVTYEVAVIGQSVFKQNEYLEEVIVPFTVERIENYAFEACANMRTLRFEIGSRLTYIGVKAFYETSKLTYIDLPDSLVEIDDRAFAYSGLVTVDNTVYSKLRTIGDYAFYYTVDLSEIVFNGVIEEIGAHAFEYSGVSDITFGERARITEIQAYCFANCYNLSDELIAYFNDHYVTDETAFYRV